MWIWGDQILPIYMTIESMTSDTKDSTSFIMENNTTTMVEETCSTWYQPAISL